jgi:hypothetical protein
MVEEVVIFQVVKNKIPDRKFGAITRKGRGREERMAVHQYGNRGWIVFKGWSSVVKVCRYDQAP